MKLLRRGSPLIRDPLCGIPDAMHHSGRKAKCPSGWSYPMGAEALAAKLSSAQHFDEIKLHYWWSSDVARVAAPDCAAILRMEFASLSPGVSGSNQHVLEGFYDPRWDLWLYAVPSTLKNRIRGALCEDVLPSLRRWLNTSRSETWSHGRHWWSAALHEGEIRIRDDAA